MSQKERKGERKRPNRYRKKGENCEQSELERGGGEERKIYQN